MWINKRLAIISFELQKWLCYKGEFLFTFVFPAINFFVQFYLWTSLYESNNFQLIGGYGRKEILWYYFWINIIATISASNAAAIGNDIKNGTIDKELVRPMGVLKFRFWSNIGNRFPYILFVYTVLLTCFLFGFHIESLLLFGLGAFMIGVGIIINFIKNFLAGVYIPLSFLPAVIAGILTMTPLAYMSYYPVEIILGRIELSETFNIVLIGLFWMILLRFVTSFIVKRLFERYQSAGG